jgi:hypothetical protein
MSYQLSDRVYQAQTVSKEILQSLPSIPGYYIVQLVLTELTQASKDSEIKVSLNRASKVNKGILVFTELTQLLKRKYGKKLVSTKLAR